MTTPNLACTRRSGSLLLECVKWFRACFSVDVSRVIQAANANCFLLLALACQMSLPDQSSLSQAKTL